MHVKEAQSRLGSSFTWLCDTMDNVAKHHLGDAPNSEFVIDPRGRVVRRRPWSDPDQLRKDLTELVGPIAKPTRESTLNMPRIAPNRDVVRGVVPTIIRPNRMQAVQVKAGLETSKHPFYAKLRAEADSNLLRSGSGQLYLGFLIDPLYHVHWNNLSKPLHVEITSNNNTHIEEWTNSKKGISIGRYIVYVSSIYQAQHERRQAAGRQTKSWTEQSERFLC